MRQHQQHRREIAFICVLGERERERDRNSFSPTYIHSQSVKQTDRRCEESKMRRKAEHGNHDGHQMSLHLSLSLSPAFILSSFCRSSTCPTTRVRISLAQLSLFPDHKKASHEEEEEQEDTLTLFAWHRPTHTNRVCACHDQAAAC